MSHPHSVPVIDLFAGPGGLGEGFSSYRDRQGRISFRLALSIEKDTCAHDTLRLRSFYRQFSSRPPSAYLDRLEGRIDTEELFKRHPREGRAASREARQIELGHSNTVKVRTAVRQALAGADPWVLIGGPPCQAYSLIGRARRSGMAGYVPHEDVRQTLYVDYLQILADHAPSVFVMENVKGLLSATLDSRRMFDRILEDLGDPAAAVRRERGSRPTGKPQYRIHSLVARAVDRSLEPADFVVRSEGFGVPQARHRVILLGVRDDAAVPRLLCPSNTDSTVHETLKRLPPLRSGLTSVRDGADPWRSAMAAIRQRGWLRTSQVDTDVRRRIEDAIGQATAMDLERGADVLWRGSSRAPFLNHSTRAHISADLERYMFASAFAEIHEHSPRLGEFPDQLLPSHRNVARAISDSHFADRFKVQLAGKPASTVTAHIAKDGHYYIHYDPAQCRSLTVREAARLQTFPDDYFFSGPRTAQYQQVGNAVPPRLATQIAEVVARLL
jgi:DNA (cytosine-5)-methyltransferase 1